MQCVAGKVATQQAIGTILVLATRVFGITPLLFNGLVQRAIREVLPAAGRLRRVVLRQQVRLCAEADQSAVYRIVACIVEHPFLCTIEHAVRGDGDVPQWERSDLPAW